MKKSPDMILYDMRRNTSYGIIKQTIDFTEKIRFNSLSEISFKVPQKICDPLTGKWIINDWYDKIEPNNLLYVLDDTPYFEYPKRTIGSYFKKTDSAIINDNVHSRNPASMTFSLMDSVGVSGFELQPETWINNISVVHGYNWENLSTIDSIGFTKYQSWGSSYFKVSCVNYVPFQPYDTIVIKNRYNKNDQTYNIRYPSIEFIFYTDADPNTCVGILNVKATENSSGNSTVANPVYRFSINSLTTDDDYSAVQGDSIEDLKELMKDGGYFRVSVTDNRITTGTIEDKKKYSSYYYQDGNTTWMGWSFIYDGWLQLYSGERYCKTINNGSRTGTYTLPLHWFVIKDIEDNDENGIKTKTVTAMSYEFTLANRRVSLPERTMAFYIPESITDLVNSDNWIIDKEKNVSQIKHAKQYMATGLMNEIMKELPDWSIGHISSELMTRYRSVPDVEDANIYSFLMSDIENLYQCYFVFDCDNKKISAYTHEDICDFVESNSNNVILNWNNVLKSFKITNQNTDFVTALRVHTSDDTYGIGLVNPTGNSIIYNFDSVLEKMDFIADSSTDPENRNVISSGGTTRYRTLKEAVQSWVSYMNSQKNTYISNARGFVTSNLEVLAKESAVKKCISTYLSVLDKIQSNAELQNKSNYYKREQIPTITEFDNHYTVTELLNDNFLNEVRDAIIKYWEANDSYQTSLTQKNNYLKQLKIIAKRSNINYATQKKLTDMYGSSANPNHVDEDGNTIILSKLTPREIMALQPFIIMGDWTDDNSIFSDNYNAEDIISTLIDAYDRAKYDMDNYYSKPSYDFESSFANIMELGEISKSFKDIKVGKGIYINAENGVYIKPILLEIEKDYNDETNCKLNLSTDYKRRIWQFRFYDLYNSISRVSVTDKTFTFDE